VAACLIIALCPALAAAQDAASDDAPPQPIYWRQQVFAIPFKVNAPADDGAAVQVQLHVSVDQGETWQLAQEVDPALGAFTFRAQGDGEYRFSIRTVDAQGREFPDEPHRAELIVVVDTAVPRLEISGSAGQAGELQLSWQAADPHLKPETLKFEYQTESDDRWRMLAIEKADPSQPRTTRSGQAAWWPGNHRGAIKLRAEIFDLAGNRSVSQTQLTIGPQADPVARRGDGSTPERPASPAAASRGMDRRKPNATVPHPWPADQIARRPLGGNSSRNPQSSDRSAQGSGFQLRASDAADRFQTTGANLRDNKLNLSDLPAGVEPVFVNTPSVELQYEVLASNPDDVRAVELWAARDGGRTWSVVARDDDHRSPIRWATREEGLFGLRIVVHSVAGLSSPVPQSGDTPESWVFFDRTPPAAKLLAPETSGDVLVIRWRADDTALAKMPIALFYSRAPQGPWKTLAADLENRGSYSWQPDRSLPPAVYLKLQVRDRAGNLSTLVSDAPVSLPGRRPQGRIRGIKPVPHSAANSRPSPR